MNQEQKDTRRFWLSIGGMGLILVIIIVTAVVTLVSRIGKVKVEVKYAPFAATVSLDNTKITNNATNYLAPGKYRLKVEYENFETLETEVEIREDTERLYGSLSPINETGQQYMDDHLGEFWEVEGLAGDAAWIEGEKQRREFPIMDKLPIETPHYTISYEMPDSQRVNIIIQATQPYLSAAIYALMEILDEKDLAKYNILIEGLANQLEGKFVANAQDDPVAALKVGYASLGLDLSVNGERKGELYYGYLRYLAGYVSVIYRFVLLNKDGAWQPVGDPYPILTTANTPGISTDILLKVNQM